MASKPKIIQIVSTNRETILALDSEGNVYARYIGGTVEKLDFDITQFVIAKKGLTKNEKH